MNPPAAETANPLVLAGDPDRGCACFSRFVLPFAYPLERHKGDQSSRNAWEFHEAEESDWFHSASVSHGWPEAERKNYFTGETRTVLYRRARWFVLRQVGSGNANLTGDRHIDFPCKGNDGKVRAVLRAPGLVLFEFPAHAEPLSNAAGRTHQRGSVAAVRGRRFTPERLVGTG
jgi:hypothetical protein